MFKLMPSLKALNNHKNKQKRSLKLQDFHNISCPSTKINYGENKHKALEMKKNL
jgi:hypothetical protein